jgi:hypothetical protein
MSYSSVCPVDVPTARDNPSVGWDWSAVTDTPPELVDVDVPVEGRRVDVGRVREVKVDRDLGSQNSM